MPILFDAVYTFSLLDTPLITDECIVQGSDIACSGIVVEIQHQYDPLDSVNQEIERLGDGTVNNELAIESRSETLSPMKPKRCRTRKATVRPQDMEEERHVDVDDVMFSTPPAWRLRSRSNKRVNYRDTSVCVKRQKANGR